MAHILPNIKAKNAIVAHKIRDKQKYINHIMGFDHCRLNNQVFQNYFLREATTYIKPF